MPTALQMALRHKGVRYTALGWAGFITENLVLSHNRDRIIDEFGKPAYMNSYAALSTLTSASIFYGFFWHGRRQGPVFPAVDKALRRAGSGSGGSSSSSAAAAFAAAARRVRSGSPGRVAVAVGLQFVGLALFSQLAPKLQMPVGFEPAGDDGAAAPQPTPPPHPADAAGVATAGPVHGPQHRPPAPAAVSSSRLVMRCPFDFSDAKGRRSSGGGGGDDDDELYTGVHRVTRHPGLWGLGLVGLGTALLTPFVAEAVFFGMPCVFALIGGAHQDFRHRRNSGGYLSPEDDARTSNVPFTALVQGVQSWERLAAEAKWSNIGVAAFLVLSLRLNAVRTLRKLA